MATSALNLCEITDDGETHIVDGNQVYNAPTMYAICGKSWRNPEFQGLDEGFGSYYCPGCVDAEDGYESPYRASGNGSLLVF